MKTHEPDDFFPHKPFHERHEFMGTLVKGDKSVTDLHIFLQYSLIKEGRIEAKILGDSTLYRKLEILLGPGLKLSSIKTENSHRQFSSDNVYLNNIRNSSLYESGMSYKVADLHLRELDIERKWDRKENQDRHLTFYLAGPKTLWGSHVIGEQSFTGDEKYKVFNEKVELNESFPFEIETRPWYFYDRTSAEEEYNIKTSIQVITFKTSLSIEEYSDDAFLVEAKSVAEDLILLVSLLSRRWITWFRYELMTTEKLVSKIREARECSAEQIDHDSSLVPLHQSRDFIKSAFTELRKHRNENLNLYMPIVYCISANENKYLEEKFSTFFLSLERIKDMYSIKEGTRKIMGKSGFQKLSDSILSIIEKEVQDDSSVQMITQKIPELNRPSLRTQLDSLFLLYGVEWKDLYPHGAQFTLIKTRDVLFHSSRDMDIDYLGDEELRLGALLERLLLSMLGWKDYSQAPISYLRTWLQKDRVKN